MKTVKDVKEWLNQFPEETVVYFAKQSPGSNWESYGPVNFVEPDLDSIEKNYGYGDSWEFMGLRDNKGYKGNEPLSLYIGSKD